MSNVGVTSNPDIVFALTTPFNVQTDSIIDLGTNVTPTAPTLGAPVTFTLPAGLKLLPESLVTLTIANSRGHASESGAVARQYHHHLRPAPERRLVRCGLRGGASGFRRLLFHEPRSTCCHGILVKVTTPVVDTLPSNVSSATPAGGDEVTLTSTDANFTFSPTSRVLVGADSAITTSVSGGSINFVPTPGATGTAHGDGRRGSRLPARPAQQRR